ncbi:uncharacterized protein SCHCODRAFT_02641967 [Schizophyllum commune H4-8]|uniref:uncharacterized protein n=1 Tax=Schizophyllum commune (strain H4-8 / FGSC 9210) TaxID=578458 RepID=UPI00216047C3|nr:uncharacterized protein SCHCODRAFT_02641967 [Schizophyllum commune H4-8]KAI5886544.1 hypothetical protein SCHCODRAFT_02641967 [Schizophyllum commune H4-8]
MESPATGVSCPDPSAHVWVSCAEPSAHPANAPLPQPLLRSWQTQRLRSGHWVLGWLATDELCRDYCRRACHTPFHKENGDPPDDMDGHISFLRRTLGNHFVLKYDLDCRGGRVVFADRTLMKVKWAIMVSDNEGETPEQRRLPSPRVVDMIKKELGTEEEPKWYKCIDSKI